MKLILIFFLIPQFIFCQDSLLVEKVNRNPYYKFVKVTSEDTITYYLSEFDKDKKLPLIVYIQGSGYHSLFTSKDKTILPTSGHINLPYLAQGKAKVLIIEKPGVQYLDKMLPNKRNKKFDESFSLETWSKRIESVIQHVTTSENIDTSQIMLIGHSEGGVVASRVANLLKNKITHVCIMAGEGPSQLFSLYTFAKSGTFFQNNGSTEKERENYILEKWKEIQRDSINTEKFFWGFTYLRWHSFLRTSVIEELSPYSGSVLILQGDQDRNVNPEASIILYTSLLSKGKDINFKMIKNADHSFNINPNPENINGWKNALQNAMEWFLN